MLVWGRRDSAMVLGKWLGGAAADQSKTAVAGKGGAVWMSSVLTPQGLGDRQGTHTKFFNCRWNPASFEIPVEPEEVYQANRRHREGFALARSEFPEAIAVFDEKRFSKRRDLFFAGPFFAVQGRLAETLGRFDLGEGGLIPFTIYKADLETPYPGEFFLLNFGCRKRTVLPEQSRNVVKFSVHHETGFQKWEVNSWSEEGDVVVSPAVLEGPDLWFDPAIHNKIFLTDALAQALIGIGMGGVFKLKRCTIA